ncbi:MAG: hypothetical protein ACPG4T_15020 [Nannocystaceae bacterium]
MHMQNDQQGGQGEQPEQAVERAGQNFLRALRDEDAMPGAAKDRVWQRLAASVAADDEDPFEAASIKRPRTTRVATVLALAAAAVLAFWALRIGLNTAEHATHNDTGSEAVYGQTSSVNAWRAKRRRQAQPKPQPIEVMAPARSAPSEGKPTTPKATDSRPQQEAPPASERKSRRPAKPSPATGTPAQDLGDTSSLVQETRALTQARQALAEGEPGQALELLERCATKFPEGVLVEERSALRVVALCEAGSLIQGRGEARLFHKRYPASALSARVRKACPVAE